MAVRTCNGARNTMRPQFENHDLVKVVAPPSSYDRRYFGKYGIVMEHSPENNIVHVVLTNGDRLCFWAKDLEGQQNDSTV